MKPFQSFFKLGFIKIVAGSVIVCFYSCGGSEVQNKSASAYPKGEEVYKQFCQACHQANGEGLPNAFPPLAKSDYLLADKTRAIKQIINGSSGEIIVNNQKFNSTMPPQSLTDEQIADVLNYVLNSWSNNGGTVIADEVKKQRGS